jgi:putative DNA primase/helicase
MFELLSPFTEFPFTTGRRRQGEDVDRAVLLAAIFGTILRSSLKTAPLVGVSATSPRTGKGLLIEAISTLATGVDATTLPPAEAPSAPGEEDRKRITSLLMQGTQVAHLDNLTAPLGSDPLCTLLTTDRWSDRVLGANTSVTLPSRMQMFASGNNLRVRGDMVQRSIMLKLDAGVERPELRRFREPDLIGLIKKDRAKLLSAAFTILRAYRLAGRPGGGEAPLGRFEEWSREVAGCVRWLGFPDPIASQNTMLQEDPEAAALSKFLAAWHALFGTEERTASRALEEAESLGGSFPTDDPQGGEGHDLRAKAKRFLEAMVEALPGRKPNARSLGTYLAGKAGRIIDGLKAVSRLDTHSKVQIWCVDAVSAAQATQ